MKTTLRKQITITFISALVFVIAISAVANTLLLDNYYISSKKTYLKEAYKTINKIKSTQKVDNKDIQIINRSIEKSNLTLLIIDTSGSTVYASSFNSDALRRRLLEHALANNLISSDKSDDFDARNNDDISSNEIVMNYKLLEKTKNYEMIKMSDTDIGSNYLEMWGVLDNKCNFIIRSPMASINESVGITNKFLLYVLITVIVLGAILVWFMAKSICDPIKAFVILSSKMAKLDFNVKYEGNEQNEIGILGENLNTLSSELEKTIDELKIANDKLKSDVEEQERINQIQSEFVSNVSHELKTPIALIQGYAEGLESNISNDPETQKYYLDVIMDEATKMNYLVKDLLTLESYEEDQMPDLSEFDIVELIKGVITREATINSDFEICYEGEESVVINSDPLRIEQVIINYINNSINHSLDNIINVKCEKREDGKLYIGVYNKGDAIKEEDKERIWDKFYKVDKAHTRKYGGSGIGLSIVKAIIKNLGGEYGVKNFSEGVEFYIILN